MRKSTSRTLWIIAGILLIVAGLFCIFKPDTIFYSLSFLLGFVMLISGIVDIVIFVSSHRFMAGSGWFLADGILTVLLSLFVLGNEWMVTLTLPIIFGMWMMFSGITKLVNSFDLHQLHIPGWGWFTAMGLILTVVGIISFLNPLSGMAAMAAGIGFFLILEGIVSILRAYFVGRFWL